MPKKWKPTRAPSSRDWPMTILIGAIVIMVALVTGLIMSMYLFG